MEIKTGAFDPIKKSVMVDFGHAGVTHTRELRAALTADGGYDAEATAQMIEEVSWGVEHKINLGVLVNPPPPVEPNPEPEA